ncbi:MAG: fused MFS/spermidine synthase, partial [Pseudomonadota bacterium]
MIEAVARLNPADWLAAQASRRAGLYAFAGTLLLSAALLFSVQPIFAKMVLPHLGGSPSVWAVAMCFFQAALLAGYCYAHALNRFAPLRFAPIIHLTVCVIAVFALPFGLPAFADEPPSGNMYFWLIAVLTVGVGLPFFAVSANAPLLQAWFARSGHPHAHDPYFLYGASNLGSLTSLLAYPFLIEPLIGVEAQRAVWATGFVTLIVAIAVCGLLIAAHLANSDDAPAEPSKQATPDAPNADAGASTVTAEDRIGWIALAFIPSALLVAFTTHVTTDIASAPFLWVIPLATFLATFVIVFRDTSLIPHAPVLRLHPLIAATAMLTIVAPAVIATPVAGVIGFAAFVITTLVCHRALYERRPRAADLTEFYLYMSLGGVLGGMFAAIIAPQVFTSVVEYPLLVLAGLLARPGAMAALRANTLFRAAAIPAAVAAALAVALIASGLVSKFTVELLAVAALLCVAAAVYVDRIGISRLASATIASIAVFLSAGLVAVDQYTERSFFGVSRVTMSEDGQFRRLVHGSTLHGSERVFDENGKPVTNAPPTTYFHPGSPLARGFDAARETQQRPIDIAIIGLGAGSLACYVQPEDRATFFEIDPVIDHIARNPAHFTYLSRCAKGAKTVLGDARLTISKSDVGPFDYLVIDAFSSDAVPAHLLSAEAIQLYLDRLTPNGLIAMHISNRHLELESVVAATAKQVGGIHTVYAEPFLTRLTENGRPSEVIFLTRDKATADRINAWYDTRPANPRNTSPWTDDYADLLSA